MKKIFVTTLSFVFLFLSVVGVSASPRCELCKAQKNSKPQGRISYPGSTVCIKVIIPNKDKVTVHFLDKDGFPRKRVRKNKHTPHAKNINKQGTFYIGRHWFQRVANEGGKILVCLGDGSKTSVAFDTVDVVTHLKNGKRCISPPVCLFPGAKCPK